ncbi:MAG: extracellular solute-binding protein [Magnetococcales bacterium]|nr:extracellular solute-binding protein [Magnetococcales bacterium]
MRTQSRFHPWIQIAFILVLLLPVITTRPVMAEEKLVIVTPFPKLVTEPFQSTFEKLHPEIKIKLFRFKTEAGIKAVQKGVAEGKAPDLFWASAKDAFEILSDDHLLVPYQSATPGIAKQIGGQLVHDADFHFTGFALSSYGIMWNDYFTRLHGIPDPRDWEDLTEPAYFGQLAMCTPALSGTTHMTVESILQNYGWEQGWMLLKGMAGNVRQFARNSIDVPDAVVAGTAGAGLVIDFYGLTNKSAGHDVDFVTPKRPSLVPANIALVKNGANPKAAKAFIDFVLTPEGQKLLLLPEISRLPVNPSVYAQAPRNYPNPFTNNDLLNAQPFDVMLSKDRYGLINHLFDAVLVHALPEIQAATKAIHQAHQSITRKSTLNTPWFSIPGNFLNAGQVNLAREKRDQARKRLGMAPIPLERTQDPKLVELFPEGSKQLSEQQKSAQEKMLASWLAQARTSAGEAEKLAQEAVRTLTHAAP